MLVHVRLYAELARHVPGGERQKTIELPDGSSVADLLAALAVPEETAIIIGLNGALADRAALLSDGDRLELITQMQGGTEWPVISGRWSADGSPTTGH